jgi:hypothetical protein
MVFHAADGAADGNDGGGADGGAGADAAAGVAESWHSQFGFFKDNPDAAKRFSKYKTADEAFKGADEAVKRFGKPYHLPDDHAKLSGKHKAEVTAYVRKMSGVPESPEGYEFNVPDDTAVDDQGMSEFRKLAHERGVDPETAQGLLDLQFGLVGRLNKARAKIIEGMTNKNYQTFLAEDCEGDKEVAGARLEMVKKYLQTQCKGKDGQPDAKLWEAFSARIMHGDRIIELPLLRALTEAAQMHVGTGGAPGGSSPSAAKPGAFNYGEMDGK